MIKRTANRPYIDNTPAEHRAHIRLAMCHIIAPKLLSKFNMMLIPFYFFVYAFPQEFTKANEYLANR